MSLSRRTFVAAGSAGLIGWNLRHAAAAPKPEQKGSESGPAHAPLASFCDYARSFVTFRSRKAHANLARLQIESRCVIIDGDGKPVEEFFQYASCKSEDEYVEKNLFLDPNYDFSGVFSRDHYVIYRAGSPAPTTRPYAERGDALKRFVNLKFQVKDAREVTPLRSPAEVVAATLAGLPLIGRTEFKDDATGLSALLEYPIKTMNVQDERQLYQVDTGPIAFPDFAAKPAEPKASSESAAAVQPVDRIELAFIAYNRPEEAYVILQRRQPLPKAGPEAGQVTHYSEIRNFPAKNSLYSVEG